MEGETLGRDEKDVATKWEKKRTNSKRIIQKLYNNWNDKVGNVRQENEFVNDWSKWVETSEGKGGSYLA